METTAALVWLPMIGGAVVYVLWLLYRLFAGERESVPAALAWLVRLIAIVLVVWTVGNAFEVWSWRKKGLHASCIGNLGFGN